MSHIPFTSAEHKAQEYRRNEMCALNHNHKAVGLQMYYTRLFGLVLIDLCMTSDKKYIFGQTWLILLCLGMTLG